MLFPPARKSFLIHKRIFQFPLSRIQLTFCIPNGKKFRYHLTALSISDCLQGNCFPFIKKNETSSSSRRLSIGICTTNKSDCTSRLLSDFKGTIQTTDECTWEAFWCLQKRLEGSCWNFVDLEDQKRIKREEKRARRIKHWVLCSRKAMQTNKSRTLNFYRNECTQKSSKSLNWNLIFTRHSLCCRLLLHENSSSNQDFSPQTRTRRKEHEQKGKRASFALDQIILSLKAFFRNCHDFSVLPPHQQPHL